MDVLPSGNDTDQRAPLGTSSLKRANKNAACGDGASRARRICRSLSIRPRAGALIKKIPQSFLRKGVPLRERRISMRLGYAICLASVAALLAPAAPGLARNSDTPKTSAPPTMSSPCHSYQQAADGSWTELPCQALGATAPS